MLSVVSSVSMVIGAEIGAALTAVVAALKKSSGSAEAVFEGRVAAAVSEGGSRVNAVGSAELVRPAGAALEKKSSGRPAGAAVGCAADVDVGMEADVVADVLLAAAGAGAALGMNVGAMAGLEVDGVTAVFGLTTVLVTTDVGNAGPVDGAVGGA